MEIMKNTNICNGQTVASYLKYINLHRVLLPTLKTLLLFNDKMRFYASNGIKS